MIDVKELQARADALTYPENHSYDVATLAPSGKFSERLGCHMYTELFRLFMKNRFNNMLDVGCNKGGFSFQCAEMFKSITAIDADHNMIDVAREVQVLHQKESSNIMFMASRFDAFTQIPHRFDVVYFGQCTHYLFRDAYRRGEPPLHFLDKASLIAGRYIILDSAFDGDPSVECDADHDVWPEIIHNMATIEGYAYRLRPHFRLVKYGWSGNGATRYLAFFERIS